VINYGMIELEHETIKLPKNLLKEIDDFVKQNPNLGYTGKTEFIKEAARLHLHEYSSENKKR